MGCRAGIVARFVLVSAILVLGACTAKNSYESVGAASGTGIPSDMRAVIAQTDWSDPEPFILRLNEYEFIPPQLVFRSGRPYRLHMENTGNKAHSFVSEGFFRSIAVKQVVTPQGTVETPVIRRIELAADEQQDITFVPLSPGRYELECDEPLHAIFGMTGRIEVQ
jgi:uncharacterized cupredoxin-like copper-binding protein